jgi:hypothetical protein
VARGNVAEGDACERREDCLEPGSLCASGHCRAPQMSDLMIECDASGATPGALNADPACPGQVCAQVGNNQEMKTGICTADCTTGLGCPNGAICLQLTVGGSPPSFFCSAPCQRDNQCAGGFACVPVEAGKPDKHCWVNPPQ